MDDAARQLLNLSQKELDKLPAAVRQKIEAVRRQVLAAQRLRTVQTARDSLLDFTQMSMPDPANPDDVTQSRYKVHPIHEFLAKKLEAVERGECLRLIISVQPRVGKSELVSKKFPAWALGRDPYRQVIATSYGEELSKEFGRDVRATMKSAFYQQVFPGVTLRKGSQAMDRLQTEDGGIANFVGAGGALTGRGADLLLIDDILKDAEEARSRATKDKHWEWFTRVALSRVMGIGGAVVITMTRWAEDDLIGRLTDPSLEYVSEEDAKTWEVINIPAFAEEDDPLGREPGEILWPERTPEAFLHSFRRLDPAGFAALYMGRPSPPEGNFFKREQIKTYQPQQLPSNLRYYAASDHAVSLAQKRDRTCMGVIGLDEDDNIWVLPDLVWARLDAEDQVEAMLNLMAQYKPLNWWAEKGHISQSLGPFLRKRMVETGTFTTITEKVPVKDKQTRAQAIQARTSMGKVYLPSFAPWFGEALDEMLTFPNGAHDDFCVAADTEIRMADGSDKRIDQVQYGDEVTTPYGTGRVIAAACTNEEAKVYRVTFSDGTSLVATGNHPVATEEGFVRVDSLPRGSVVHCLDTYQGFASWPDAEHRKLTLSNIKAAAIAGIQRAVTTITESIIMRPSRVVGSCTGMSGRTITGLSPQDMTYITGTGTHSTTTRGTLSAFLFRSTERCTSASAAAPRSTWLDLTRSAPWHRPGTSPTKAAPGTLGWSAIPGISGSGARSLAKSAAKSLRRRFLIGRNFVVRLVGARTGSAVTMSASSLKAPDAPATTAEQSSPTHSEHSATARPSVGRKSVISVEKLPDRQPVHNLTVAGEHVYFANGVLTHNCDFMAWIGIGLSRHVKAEGVAPPEPEQPRSGTLEWILSTSDRLRKRNNATEQAARYLQ